MRSRSLLFRLAAGVASFAVLLSPLLPNPALAQTQPFGAAETRPQAADPPARVGRLARTSGTVSFHTAGAEQWSPATPNYPVTTGDAFWTEPNAQAELQVDASSIWLNGGTELDVAMLDQTGFQATEGQGEAYLHLRGVQPGESWSLQTPRGTVTLSSNGRYAVVAGDTEHPTTVTVLDGSAQVTGPGVSLPVAAGQTATITGDTSFTGSIGPAQPDSFLDAMLRQERPPPQPAVAPPAAVAAMPGGSDLAAYGTWTEAPEYGPVWYPQVEAGWVPYREGHWVWVAPWGWTWVDDDPWGFTPFHYGRWVEVGGRWAWTPGLLAMASRPVYAPALVTFFGVAAGVGLGAALASRAVGWCPLGPREPYHPWYRASERYLREVNIRHVNNVSVINRSVTVNNFVNRGAATMVPAGVMQASRPVRGAAQRVDPRLLETAHATVGQALVHPTRATFGVTPAVARQVPLAPVPAGVSAAQRVAPGPAIHPAGSSAVRVERGFAQQQPHLPPVAQPALVTPGARHSAAPAAVPYGTPGAGATPALVQPGAGRPIPHSGFSPPVHQAVPTASPGFARPPATGASTPAAPHVMEPAVQHPSAPHIQRAPAHAAPPQFHAPVQPAAPAVHTPSPQIHAPVPQAHVAPPQVHAPTPQVHVAPPQIHAPAPAPHPAPAPQVHAAPAAAPHPAPAQHPQDHQKRPNEH